MSAICIIDTTIFVEILNVPVMAGRHAETLDELRSKIEAGESLFLPMATIVETGNHIAQNGDGRQRRATAAQFVDQVRLALDGISPFRPMDFLDADRLGVWLDEFPDHATRGVGLGDVSIIQDWERMRRLNRGRRVYIWSLDDHLAGYDAPARI